MPPTGTQAIDRAAELLSKVVLAEAPPAFGDLVSDTGLTKSTAARLLQALERHRLVHRDEEGGYEAGSLFAQYATRHDPRDELVQLAQPSMQALHDATGETVNLAMTRGDSVVQVAQIDSTFMLSTTNWLDIEVPPHCSALGKVFYAAATIPLPTSPLERRTTHTITTLAALKRDLELVRSQGFAQTLSELEIGLDAVAAPVFDQSGDVVAALGISGPSDRLHHRLEQLGSLLKDHSEALSDVLGHQNRKEGAA